MSEQTEQPPGIDYPYLMREALRGVLRSALTQVAESGLPGDHHFYIELATRAPGVILPAGFVDRFPSTMTIVLQHRFWDLVVDQEGFSVTLEFGRQPKAIRVPFAAVVAYSDPAAGLALEIARPAAEESKTKPVKPTPRLARAVKAEAGDVAEPEADLVASADSVSEAAAEHDSTGPPGGNVVSFARPRRDRPVR